VLAAAAEPEVAEIQKEVDPVLLLRDGVFRRGILKGTDPGDGELEARGGPGVRPNRPLHLQGGLQPEGLGGLEVLLGEARPLGDGLDVARPVPELEEADLAGAAFVVHPPLEANRPALIGSQIPDRDPRRVHRFDLLDIGNRVL